MGIALCFLPDLHGVHVRDGGAGELRPDRPVRAGASNVSGHDGHTDDPAHRCLRGA